MPYDHYETAGPLFVRMAGAPRTRYLPTGETDPWAHIRRLASDPLLREAVRVASGSLADALDRLDAGERLSPKNLTRTALSLTRYALRHSGRPTPFGLFAGVAVAGTGPARAEVTGPGRKSVRVDGTWLEGRVRRWLTVPEVRHRISVAANDLCRVRGDRLLLAAGRGETSVRRNALVDWARETAAAPVPYGELIAKAAAAFPEVPAERVDGALAQLLRHGFLLCSLGEPDVDGRLLDRVEEAVAGLPDAVAELRGARAALAAYERVDPGAGETAWRTAVAALSPDRPAGTPPVQVDLGAVADVRLPEAVAEEVRRYASMMWTLSPRWAALPHLRDYQDAFVDRYGTTGLVPLGELTDPHRGLGLPAAYRDPDAAPPPHDPRDDTARRRRLLLAELVQEAMSAHDGELRLTSDVLALLAQDEPSEAERRTAPPQSLDLCFHLLADDLRALDRGEFRLIAGPHTGSWTAGATVARFAGVTGATEDLARLLGRLDDGRALPAQVVFRPHDPRALNPMRVPALVPHRIPVGVYADPALPGHLDWRRLLVGVDASGLRLTDPATGRTVLPVVPHMVNPHKLAPGPARLLIDIGHGRGRPWTGWDWYGLEDLPALPRVTFGRVTLCPRRWKPDRHLRAAAADPGRWDTAVAAWRDRHGIPRHVQLVLDDRGHGLDLDDPWHRTVLRHEVRTAVPFLVTEDPSADGTGLGWAHGHRTEVVVPLVHRPEPVGPAPAAPGTVAPSPRAGRHLPGEDWLYAKLYAAEDAHAELLGRWLPRLVRDAGEDADRWFFLRYRDPDPHLRLRFHGDPGTLHGRLLPALARHARSWQDAGLLRRLVLDTYEPETGRYGGPDALPHAERLFHLDSRSALGQLALRARGGPRPPDEVLAAANHAALLESLGDWDWCGWVDAVFSKGAEHSAFQRHRAAAREAVLPGRAATGLAALLGAPHLEELWAGAPAGRAYGPLVVPHDTAALLGLLHMQHNRLFGIDRDGEERGYAVLRGIARDHLGRRRHTGTSPRKDV
ncbi:lantibiotic dehydratase [Streptomyces mobaraensis]|uniref:Lantibiotic dehydratase n=1 Tax=Streptomyces mobaraensis TaxID=35621 RepID=A0A5N5WEI8_STRMB|nr:lantibiotic dehydratase [Streptomyces mobaraensis]KAB7852327.1 lantibiotic dehydratase [Streptomyces mobaraensis]